MLRPRVLLVAVGAASLLACGCAEETIVEALAVDNPALVEADTAPPPVPPDALTITPTGLSPMATPAVAPDPIRPTMDEVYRTRRLPPGVEPSPVQRPMGHEAPPEGSYRPGRIRPGQPRQIEPAQPWGLDPGPTPDVEPNQPVVPREGER